jgi:hypothetical protein
VIRFVDLSTVYWTDPQNTTACCAFLNTVSDTFLSFAGDHVCISEACLELIEDEGLRERCRSLLPEGFFQ